MVASISGFFFFFFNWMTELHGVFYHLKKILWTGEDHGKFLRNKYKLIIYLAS